MPTSSIHALVVSLPKVDSSSSRPRSHSLLHRSAWRVVEGPVGSTLGRAPALLSTTRSVGGGTGDPRHQRRAWPSPTYVTRDAHACVAGHRPRAAGAVAGAGARDERHTGEMWNSNSVVAWLLERAGLSIDRIQPPPGWPRAGLVSRRRDRAAGSDLDRHLRQLAPARRPRRPRSNSTSGSRPLR